MSANMREQLVFLSELTYKRRVRFSHLFSFHRPSRRCTFLTRSKFMKFSFRKLYLFPFFVAICAVGVFAQEDQNPDSPTPGLLSSADRSRILAVNSRGWDG